MEIERLVHMTGSICKVAIPSILAQVASLLMELVNVAFIGHLGNTAKVAGLGLGNMYINVFCQSIIMGLNGAILTLASQAYGSGNLPKCGLFLNRGRFIVLCAFAPLVIVLLLWEKFMLMMG